LSQNCPAMDARRTPASGWLSADLLLSREPNFPPAPRTRNGQSERALAPGFREDSRRDRVRNGLVTRCMAPRIRGSRRDGVVAAAGPSQIAERVLQALDAADASVAGLPGTVAGVVLPASFAARIGTVTSSPGLQAADGLELPVGVVVGHRLQLRLPRVAYRAGMAGRSRAIQLPRHGLPAAARPAELAGRLERVGLRDGLADLQARGTRHERIRTCRTAPRTTRTLPTSAGSTSHGGCTRG
jgi:hypothetical protein